MIGASMLLAGRAKYIAVGLVFAGLVTWGGVQTLRLNVAERNAAEIAALHAQELAQAEQAAREEEHAKAVKAQEVADAYAKERNRAVVSAAGARTELERLRNAIANIGPDTGAGGGTSCRTDGAPDLRPLVRSGAEALTAMAAACDAEESKLKALQEWVSSQFPARDGQASSRAD